MVTSTMYFCLYEYSRSWRREQLSWLVVPVMGGILLICKMKLNPICRAIPRIVLFYSVILSVCILLGHRGGKVSFTHAAASYFLVVHIKGPLVTELKGKSMDTTANRMLLLFSVWLTNLSSPALSVSSSSPLLSLGGSGNKHTSCLSVLPSWQVEAYLTRRNRCSFLSPFECLPLSATRYHVNVMYRRNCCGHGY